MVELGIMEQDLVWFRWVLTDCVMVKRGSWGYSYSVVRGEILRSSEDELVRKRLSRMFSLIRNESRGIEGD